VNAPNPKKAFGDKKPQLHLVPLSGMLAQWEAHFDGALKYTEVNWRRDPVEVMTYIDAIIRHVRLYENGEKYARDTLVQNLGAVAACCNILIDAELHGTLIDNRTHSPQTCDLLHGRGEDMVKHLRAAQAEREQAKADLALVEAADKTWREAKFELLKRDALARATGENLDGSPRRETVLASCETCGDPAQCNRVGVCFQGNRDGPADEPFKTCGRCKSDTECQNSGYCRA
jgi:hypothetical protein